MKRGLLLLSFFLLCHWGMAQTNEIWMPFQAKASENSIELQGNGYKIETRSLDIQNSKGRKVKEKYSWELASSLLGCYTKKQVSISQDGMFSVYSWNYQPYIDSIPNLCTVYVYLVAENLLSAISFSKHGEVDSLFQRRLVDEICTNGISQSVFMPVGNDTICFLGQKIENPRISDDKGRKIMFAYTLGLKSFRNNYRKLAGNYEYLNCSWDSYFSDEEAEKARQDLILNYKKRYKTVLFEGKDTIIFRGEEMLADRIVWQLPTYYYDKYRIRTNYFVKAEITGMPTLINLEFATDSISNEIPLPVFIEENIFQLKHIPHTPPIVEDSIPVSDTIFIAKKNRLPIWTYYHKNTRITGLSLGIGEIDGLRNVTTNGIKLDVIGSSLTLALMPPFLLMPPSLMMESRRHRTEEDIAILYKNRFSTTNGISFSIAGSLLDSHIVNGLGFGGLVTTNYRTNGISIAGLSNGTFYSNGLQAGGCWTYTHKLTGLQIGVLGNSGMKVRGVQIGMFNFATDHVHGLQIGLFNSAKRLKGLQIGLWNKSDRRSFPLFNWGF